jgi:hypothetical protein
MEATMTTTLPLSILKRILLAGWLLLASVFVACFVNPAPYGWRGWKYRSSLNMLFYRMNVWIWQRLGHVTLKLDRSATPLQKRERAEDSIVDLPLRLNDADASSTTPQGQQQQKNCKRLDNVLRAIGSALAAVLCIYLAAKNGDAAGLILLVIAGLFGLLSVLWLHLARRRDP